jgi:uncharacterized protein (TIGR02246 family)
MKTFVLIALFLGAVAVARCETEEDIEALFDDWNDALQTMDPEKVADMYAEGSVLLPTISNEIRVDREGKVDYFEHFLQKHPYGTVIESVVRFVGGDKAAVHSGIYEFNLTNPDGTFSIVPARFSYTYEKGEDGKWLIVDHHSSQMPEQPDPEMEAVKNLIREWNATLTTGDPAQVAAMYSDDAILLPTVSNDVRENEEGKLDYFEMFLTKQPYIKEIPEEHVRFTNANKDTAINSGIYLFSTKGGDVMARYTFVYGKQPDGSWKIEDHHSSQMPEGMPAPAPEVAPQKTAGRKML